MDRTQEFYSLFLSTFWRLVKERLGAKDAVLLGLAIIIGPVFAFLWKDMEFMIEQTMTFVIYSLLPFLALLLIYFSWAVVRTPVEIYAELKKRLANRSWYDVDFEPIHFTDHGAHIAALKIRNDKPIEITGLTLTTNTLWRDGNVVAEQRFHSVPKNVLSPDGGEVTVQIAKSTSQEAYLDEITSKVNNVEDTSRRVYLEAGVTYYIDITLVAVMETVKVPTPYPFFKGTLLYAPPQTTLVMDSLTPHRKDHEI